MKTHHANPDLDLDAPLGTIAPFGLLVSYWYYRNVDLAGYRLPLIADSGAFSAHTLGGEVSLPEYAGWLDAHADRFRFAFNLDDLADPEVSWRNWLALRDHGRETIPVLHYGEDPAVMERYVDAGATMLACGAIVLQRPTIKAARWSAHALRHSRDRGWPVRWHALGVDPRSSLARLPWSSYDSSAWSAAWRYGRLRLTIPGTLQVVTIQLDGQSAGDHGRLLRDAYRTTPEEVATSYAGNRHLLIRVGARSFEYALAMRRKAQPDLGAYLVNTTREDDEALFRHLPAGWMVEGVHGHLTALDEQTTIPPGEGQ